MSNNFFGNMLFTFILCNVAVKSLAERISDMKNKPKIAVLGGDLRQYAVAKRISKEKAEVYACGLCVSGRSNDQINQTNDWSEALRAARAVVLPLPTSTDNKVLNCPGYRDSERISLDKIVDLMDEGTLLFGGRIPQRITDKATKKGIDVHDYFLSEALQIKNAYITAEAALSIAMNSLDKCVREARFVITGSGRISRLLAELLRKIGADVTVAARNTDALTYASLIGCKTLAIRAHDDAAGDRWYSELEHGYDVIFNTVPAWLFDRHFLENADNGLLMIELASSPGGIDVCAARELSSNVVWASSLPGKYAPESAGYLIAECVIDKLMEVRVL